MIAFEFADALGEGSTLVTPNNRLARRLVTRYDNAQRDMGRRAWVAGRVLPWQSWLNSLWLDVLAASALPGPRELISSSAAGHLWGRIVAQETPELLDTRGAAAQAADAWALFHAWRRPDDHFQPWSRAGIGDDAETFAQWAQRYASTLAERGLVDPAQLADVLADAAPKVPAWRGHRIITVGFIEFAPQQRRLLSALRNAGVDVAEHGVPTTATSSRYRVACANPRAEIERALAWARERALADPSARIGIVIDDLASRRDEVDARAEDMLCPALASRVLPDAVRPFALSLGIPLAEVPVVAAAIDLIALGTGSLPIAVAAALLRSAHLPDAELHWMRRAAVERDWREQGLRTVNFGEFMRALDRCDAGLATRWRVVPLPGRAARSPSQWASDWRDWLRALGWPGNRPLGSGEWQACEAWSKLLANFRLLDAVASGLTREEAQDALRAMGAQTIFQPESPPARIQIMGVLEASGIDFDALWITGTSAERWPPALQPCPLLPITWQRERHVPRSNPGVDLARARALTAGFAGAAHEVVASHALMVEGLERAGSSLFAQWEACAVTSLPTAGGHAMTIAAHAGDLVSIDDDRAPPLPMGARARGGVGIVESQSTCPFQAFARYRLHGVAWPEPSEGLTAQERGVLLHATLAAFWQDLGDQAALRRLTGDQLDAGVATAVTQALSKLDRVRWQALPAAVAAGERQRLADIVRAWLASVESARPPFAVRDLELPLDLAVGGLDIKVRIDRVDALADGGVAVIDYKSGRAVAPAKWFAARPSGTQVGLYALALSQLTDAPKVQALVYAQLKAGEIGVQGMAAEESTWPPLKALSQWRDPPVAAWEELARAWADGLGAVATEFREGYAAVSPRGGQACMHCNLHALCRIQALDDPADAPAGNDDG